MEGGGCDMVPGEGWKKWEQWRGSSGRLDFLSPSVHGSEMESYQPSTACEADLVCERQKERADTQLECETVPLTGSLLAVKCPWEGISVGSPRSLGYF